LIFAFFISQKILLSHTFSHLLLLTGKKKGYIIKTLDYIFTKREYFYGKSTTENNHPSTSYKNLDMRHFICVYRRDDCGHGVLLFPKQQRVRARWCGRFGNHHSPFDRYKLGIAYGCI
jgi:hypothetical protein